MSRCSKEVVIVLDFLVSGQATHNNKKVLKNLHKNALHTMSKNHFKIFKSMPAAVLLAVAHFNVVAVHGGRGKFILHASH